MKIQTTRFGEIDIDESKIITFTEPILGFPDSKKFVLLDNAKSLFKWLQSTENKELAFVMIDPLQIMDNYEVSVTDESRLVAREWKTTWVPAEFICARLLFPFASSRETVLTLMRVVLPSDVSCKYICRITPSDDGESRFVASDEKTI